MKRIVIFLLLIFFAIILMFATAAANEESCSLDAVYLSEDGSQLIAEATLTKSFAAGHDSICLFRVSPHNTAIDALSPASEVAVTDGGPVRFSLPYDTDDAFGALYGYRLAAVDENGDYFAITETVYRSDIARFAPHTQNYPIFSSKKGLQVQLSTDAQLLGVKHTTVNVFFNELIAYTEEKAVTFLYGGTKYYLNSTVLSALDYRIRSLTDAGIHIYMNCLLTFDTTASPDLYYKDAEGNSNTLFAPNVSTAESLRRYAAVLHFLAGRYSENGAPNGFCGSFILGYEVNEEGDSNSAGIPRLEDYVGTYATFLRTADTAVRSAYANARVFISLSNRFRISEDSQEPYLFGSYEFLTALTKACPTVPFGISINPYPSALSNTAFWIDPESVDNVDTLYITMKNLSVLTDLLDTDTMRCLGERRPLIIGEFGVSGKLGSDTESLQAAAYWYAYTIAEQNPAVEAFLWHRHVDHAAESDLYYGLYAASDLLLEPSTPKLLREVFDAVDRTDGQKTCENYLALLPDGAIPESSSPLRREITVQPLKTTLFSPEQNTEYLFDFSQSLYDFYPTDNTAYLELCEENAETFMRIALLQVSSFEHMGAGTTLNDLSRMNAADIMTLRVRVVSPSKTALVRLRLIGENDDSEIVYDASAEVPCNVWTEISFPLEEFHSTDLASCKLRLWTRVASGTEESYLDASAITLGSEKTTAPLRIFFTVLLVIATVAILLFLLFLLFLRWLRLT